MSSLQKCSIGYSLRPEKNSACAIPGRRRFKQENKREQEGLLPFYDQRDIWMHHLQEPLLQYPDKNYNTKKSERENTLLKGVRPWPRKEEERLGQILTKQNSNTPGHVIHYPAVQQGRCGLHSAVCVHSGNFFRSLSLLALCLSLPFFLSLSLSVCLTLHRSI